MYTIDQTSVYFNKIPNRTHMLKKNAKKAQGTKIMKSKDRLVIMVCMAVDGSNAPVVVVGNLEIPICF